MNDYSIVVVVVVVAVVAGVAVVVDTLQLQIICDFYGLHPTDFQREYLHKRGR